LDQTTEKTLQTNGQSLLERKNLERATIVGIVLQAMLAVAGHFSPWVRTNAFLFGGMMISAVAGYLYALDVAKGYGPGALGGTLAGGTCAIIGIAVSVILRDLPMVALAIGTLICTLTGAVGGIFGQMAANLRKLR
jgi:hypothetical protein